MCTSARGSGGLLRLARSVTRLKPERLERVNEIMAKPEPMHPRKAAAGPRAAGARLMTGEPRTALDRPIAPISERLRIPLRGPAR